MTSFSWINGEASHLGTISGSVDNSSVIKDNAHDQDSLCVVEHVDALTCAIVFKPLPQGNNHQEPIAAHGLARHGLSYLVVVRLNRYGLGITPSSPASRLAPARLDLVRSAGTMACRVPLAQLSSSDSLARGQYTLHPALRKQDFKARQNFLAHFRNHGRFLSSISQCPKTRHTRRVL